MRSADRVWLSQLRVWRLLSIAAAIVVDGFSPRKGLLVALLGVEYGDQDKTGADYAAAAEFRCSFPASYFMPVYQRQNVPRKSPFNT